MKLTSQSGQIMMKVMILFNLFLKIVSDQLSMKLSLIAFIPADKSIAIGLLYKPNINKALS